MTLDSDRFAEQFDAFCERRIAPRAQEQDSGGHVTRQTWDAIRDTGFFRIFHPPESGGIDVCVPTMACAMESLARACPGTYWHVMASTFLCGKILQILGNDEQRKRYMQPLIEGTKIGCFCTAESGSVGDHNTYRATVRKSGDGYVLDGFKARISNGPVADFAIVVVQLVPDDPSDKRREMRFVFVDLNQKGVKRFRIPTLGLRAMPWGGLLFENVRVQAQDVVNADRSTVLRAIEWGQVLSAYASVGIAEAALRASMEFVSDRISYGFPLANLESVHRILATMRRELGASRALSQRALAYKVNNDPRSGEASPLCKIDATEMAVAVADMGAQLHASWGISQQFAIERHYRDAISNAPAGASNDLLRDFAACRMTDQDPFANRAVDWITATGLKEQARAAALHRPSPSRMYANPADLGYAWSPLDAALMEHNFASGRTARTVHVVDTHWDKLEALAREMGVDRDALINQTLYRLLSSYDPFNALS